MASGTNLPFLSITDALIPAVPLFLNFFGSTFGRNSFTLFIITVFDIDERNSPDASERNWESKIIFDAPDESISSIFGIMFFTFSEILYPYGLKTGTALGPTSRLPSDRTIQCGSRNGYSGCFGTE